MTEPLRQVMGQSYLCFPIRDAVRRELIWTHRTYRKKNERVTGCDRFNTPTHAVAEHGAAMPIACTTP